ncbi:MAG: DUF2849 domain-containing protein [Oceanicaulis sp.]
MKAVTANRLTDGKVVYRTPEGAWSPEASEAEHLADDAAADAALNAALRDVLTVVGPYLIEIEPEAGFTPAGRKHVRETIRLSGPTTGSTKAMPGGQHVSV